MKTKKMTTQKLIVSVLAIICALFVVATISAAEVTNDALVTVDESSVASNSLSVVAGDTITLKVYFTSLVDASDVRIKAEIEGDKVDVSTISDSFDVEAGKQIPRKVLTLKVPYELKDQVSDNVALNIKIWNGDYKTELAYTLRVLRPSYNADVKSISIPQSVEAGETFAVDVVLTNIGYNDLEDVYVKAKITSLGVEKSAYFGDIVAIENDSNCCNDDEDQDTVVGKLYLKAPYNVKPGVYTLEVQVTNDDMTTSEVKQIVVTNDFPENVVVTSSTKTVAVGEDAVYDLILVNPTDKVKVYRLVTESGKDFSSQVDEAVVAVPAGSTRSVQVTASADKEGEHKFKVDVLSGSELVGSVVLTANVEGSNIANPVVILTVVLVIVFVVLLVVLIVLMTRRNKKAEEFGESYY